MTENKKFKTLYICYFGLREPLVQTQVLPYLREVKKLGNVEISILTFEPDLKKKWTDEQLNAEKRKLADEGIGWHVLPYHRSPSVPATFYDIVRGTLFVRRLLDREHIDILHARIHVPMLMAVLARKLSRKKPKILFDIRGFFLDEYVDAGRWKKDGSLYKTAKKVERWLMTKADGFVVLTEKAREFLFPESRETGFDKLGRPVEVIPCCVDFASRFKEDPRDSRIAARDELGLANRLVITHLGALGGVYRTQEIADLLAAARRRYGRIFAMFLTQSDPALIIPLLKESGFTETDIFVNKVHPADLQKYLAASDIALSLVNVGLSGISRSPTKIPEYLACGLPVISNKGVGDIDELINTDKVGVLLDDLGEEGYQKALDKMDVLLENHDLPGRCRQSAKERFDLEKIGGEKYRSIYRKLSESNRKT